MEINFQKLQKYKFKIKFSKVKIFISKSIFLFLKILEINFHIFYIDFSLSINRNATLDVMWPLMHNRCA